MAQARWRRSAALMVSLVTAVGCSDDGDSKEQTDSEIQANEDGGAQAAGNDASVGSSSNEAFFRLDKFVLKEPSLVLRVLGLETPAAEDVQSMLDTSLAEDAEPADGNIDLNMLVRFSGTSDPAKTAGMVTFGGGLCPYPASAAKACLADPSAPFFNPAMSYANASQCAIEGGSESVSGACFKSGTGRMAVSLPLFGPVPLEDAQVIASWATGGEDGITEGWVRGFLTEQTAMTTTIKGEVPSHLALVDIQTGTPLTTFLPEGGKETRGGRTGWPFLAQFTAKPARFDAGK
jgi:hypothetical protein